MKTNNRIKGVKAKPTRTQNAKSGLDLELMAEMSASQVEHRTILEFLRAVPHKWHPDEIARYGDKVKRMAEALQLPFVPSINPSLGVIRAYPAPLLGWVYSTMAAQFGWPTVLALTAGDQREELRRHEGAKRHLAAAAAEHEPPTEVAEAIKLVVSWLGGEADRLRSEAGVTEAPKGELRVVAPVSDR
jgi:hypothetical protein